MKIGIIGFGFVGQAVYQGLYNNAKHQVSITDPDKGYNDVWNSSELDFIFVCVSTPENDFTNVSTVLGELEEMEYKGIVVIKSTVPATYLAERDLRIVMNPEFLNQRSANDDFANQKYIVLGGNADDTAKVENLYNESFKVNASKYEHCTIEEASTFKYIRNIKSAYNILFWNYVHEVFGESRKYSNMLENMPVGELSLVGMDGELGYSGACFPKDVNSTETAKPHELTKFMKKFNNRLQDI